MNTKENVLCEERKEKERESGGVGEYKYEMKLVRAVAALAAALPKRRERWWREMMTILDTAGCLGCDQ